MFGIKIKPETKAKIKMKVDRVIGAVKPWIVPMAVITTISAAWSGHVNSVRNEREIRELQDKVSKDELAIDANFNLHDRIDERVTALEQKNKELLDEACDFTEGKETAA